MKTMDNINFHPEVMAGVVPGLVRDLFFFFFFTFWTSQTYPGESFESKTPHELCSTLTSTTTFKFNIFRRSLRYANFFRKFSR